MWMKYHTQKEPCKSAEHKRTKGCSEGFIYVLVRRGRARRKRSPRAKSAWALIGIMLYKTETYESRLIRGVCLFVNAMWLIYCRPLLQGAHHAMTAALKHGRIFPHRVSLMKNKLFSVLPGSPLFRCLFWKVTGVFFSFFFFFSILKSSILSYLNYCVWFFI